ncbi:hypothetical protein EDB85DRAFT_108668 [Lactarius pseudohatsudake]|nr:hypothetical protein EDB85DRAFT_108668 [Lactarius pseudohatsudake]
MTAWHRIALARFALSHNTRCRKPEIRPATRPCVFACTRLRRLVSTAPADARPTGCSAGQGFSPLPWRNLPNRTPSMREGWNTPTWATGLPLRFREVAISRSGRSRPQRRALSWSVSVPKPGAVRPLFLFPHPLTCLVLPADTRAYHHRLTHAHPLGPASQAIQGAGHIRRHRRRPMRPDYL